MTGTKKPKLNENQKKAIDHKSGPILVIAGAGTGKTRVITERIEHLIRKQKINPNEILALTFTEKAAQEMVNRIGDVMPLGYEEPWVNTFHSFADKILKSEGLEIGLDPSYKIISDSQQWLLLRKNLFKFKLEYFRPLGNPTKFISAILKFISRLQDENISPEEFKKFAQEYTGELDEKNRWQELAYIYSEYESLKIVEKEKAGNTKLDFGNLITYTLRLFEERPNILKKYQKQFKHVMVDEFQDTNYSQYELIKLLFPATEKSKTRSLMLVGDDSQSIYKFRGAAVSNILQFIKDYPESEMITLIQNYRSTQKILDPAYTLIQNNNPDTLESKLNISKKLISDKKETSISPNIFQTETVEDEVEMVILKIFEILGKETQYTYKDFAILARANSHLDPFVLALRKYGLPYQLVGNRGLYDRDEVRDIISCLKTLINPEDSVSLFKVLNIDSLEIPNEEISYLLSESRKRKISLWETVKDSKNEFVQAFIEKLNSLRGKLTKSMPSEMVYELVNSINYLDKYTQEETVENQLSLKNLNLFGERIKKFEIDFHDETREIPTIIDFVDYLDLVLEAGENPAQAEIEDIDTINLMTVHASKGLEFPVVFIVNLVSDRFPTRNRKDPIEIPDELIKETLPSGDEHIQEERRLFYVGMTRAQKYLFMTLSKNYGGKREKIPSGFLEETKLEIENIKDIQKPQVSLFGPGTGFREQRGLPKGQLPEYLSYSQIETYITCPLKYKYEYILRIPTPPSHALSFGNTIHNTLKDFHTKLLFDGKVSFDELLSMYEKNWQPLGYLDEEHRKLRFESGKKLLKTYYEKNKDLNIKHEALEKAFNLRMSGVKFYGRIDRIDPLETGGVEIIDYKTGTPKTQKEVDKDSQITIYAIAAKEALGLDPQKLSLYFVEAGEKISTTRTEEDLKNQKENINETVDKMKGGNFEATPGMHCQWCDFKSICPNVYKG